MTNISMPSSAASLAISTSWSALKWNSVTSQLLMSTGRRAPWRGSRMRCSRMARWKRWVMGAKPSGEQTIAASGVVNRSPGARVQQKWWGWMPMTRRVSLNWLCSTWAVKFPL